MPEQLVSRIVNEVSFQHGGSRVNTAGYRPRSAGVRPRSATSKDRRTMDANAHMFLATGMAEAGARRRNLALRSKALPSGRWRALRSQLQDGAKMMWSDVGAPWMYLEKAEEVVGLLLQNGALQPTEQQLLLKQRALLAGAHAHLASSVQLWRALELTAARQTAATGQSAAHAVAPGGGGNGGGVPSSVPTTPTAAPTTPTTPTAAPTASPTAAPACTSEEEEAEEERLAQAVIEGTARRLSQLRQWMAPLAPPLRVDRATQMVTLPGGTLPATPLPRGRPGSGGGVRTRDAGTGGGGPPSSPAPPEKGADAAPPPSSTVIDAAFPAGSTPPVEEAAVPAAAPAAAPDKLRRPSSGRRKSRSALAFGPTAAEEAAPAEAPAEAPPREEPMTQLNVERVMGSTPQRRPNSAGSEHPRSIELRFVAPGEVGRSRPGPRDELEEERSVATG